VDYGPAARVARQVVSRVIAQGMPKATLLNVNVPDLPSESIKGIKVTRQGLRVYRDLLVRREDPRGRPYYWIGGDAPTGVPEEGYVSITPLHLDMTAYRVMDELAGWEWG
jgi:5'-nucleotidase